MNDTLEVTTPAIDLVERQFCNHLHAPFELRNIKFTDSGAARYAAVIGFIMGIKLGGQAERAEALAEHFLSIMNRLNNYGQEVLYLDSMERERKAPRYVVQMSDDGCPNSFSVYWYTYEGIHDGKEVNQTIMFRHAENLRYRFSFNGGLIFHGFNNETFCTRLGNDSNPWGIHT
jgi:hypothetical protein